MPPRVLGILTYTYPRIEAAISVTLAKFPSKLLDSQSSKFCGATKQFNSQVLTYAESHSSPGIFIPP
jgi:hypothetical protein